MATARKLLNEASKSFEVGLSSQIEAFLKGAGKDKLKHEEAKLYSEFVQNCLHRCMTKSKNVQDKVEVEEILKTAVVCAQAYKQLQPFLDVDKTHVVPSLLYHLLRTIQDTAFTYLEYVVKISEIVYMILDDAGCPDTSHTILAAFHSILWNCTSKHLKQGTSQSLKDDLALQKLSLQFLCCTPINPAKLCVLLHTVIAYFTQFNRKWIDKGTSEMFYSIFQCIVDKLHALSNSGTSVENISVYRFVIYRVQALFIEYLVSMSDFEKAREVVQNMTLSCGTTPLYAVLIDVLSYSVIATEAVKTSKPPGVSSENIGAVNSDLTKMIQIESVENLKLVFRTLECFLQPFSSKVYDILDMSVVKVLLDSCTVVHATYEKLDAANVWDDETKDTKKKSKEVKKQSCDTKKDKLYDMPTKKQDYVQGCCQVYYKQLTLLQKIVDADSGVELFKECVDTAQKFTKFLDDNSTLLTEKSLHSKRYNIGCVCNMIGAACMQAKHYNEAASLYTKVIEQLHTCEQPNLIKMFEKLLECYMLQEKWMEAIQTIVHAFTAIDDGLKNIAVVWTRLRKEASSKDAIFQSMTFNSVIKSSGVDMKGVTSKQLLLAEYQAWKQHSRRQFDMEYPVFVELLEDNEQTPSEKAEAMVALASNMCITGYKYNNVSAGELLNKAIIALDKNLAGNESTLAVACYTKYAILHEEAIEYMKNKSGDLEYFGTADLSANSRYTLQQEQDNLPFLVRAIEMWEKSFSPKALKSVKKVCKKETVIEEKLFGLDHHIDNLILCGTRLIAMKQPQLALRALQVAKNQISNLEDPKTASELSLQVTRSLMLLGRYKEAESVMDGTGDGNKQGEASNAALLLSELYMLTGKRDTGLQILQSVLDSNDLLGKTHKVYFMQGTAKRLLSMAHCLPGGDHMIGLTNQYLLSLAFESVHCHVTVLNFLTQNKSFDRNTNKWLILNEILASMLHVCQLCRFIGLPREALCYLKSGLNISQGQGLPRWSCEFLMEMLGVQSMEAECDKALSTAESLNCILSPDSRPREISMNQSKTGCKKNNLSIDNESDSHDQNDSVILISSTLEKTPERAYVKQELDSAKKNKMKELRAPSCCCMIDDCDQCTDLVRHRLCMKAGIVLSDFLAQTDMRTTADQLLKDVQTKFEILKSIDNSDTWSSITDLTLSNDMSGVKNGHIQDPQLLYSCLETGCIKAESYLHKKEFHKVHNIWAMFQKMEKSGGLKNVLHSNILLTRLALCDASGYMLSLPENQTKLDQSSFNNKINEMTQNIDKLSITSSRKVSFESKDDESWSITGTCINLARKMAKFADNVISPVRQSVMNTLNTPVSSNINKWKMPLTTPTSNRMMVQENVSDDEDDIIVFPELKPVTPRVLTKSSRISRMKSKTEPRNLINKKPAFTIAEDPVDTGAGNLACKLNFLPQSTNDTSVNSVEEDSIVGEAKSKPRKQGKNGKCSSVSSLNENVDTADIKRKSNIPKRSVKKQASVKTKSDNTSDVLKKNMTEETEHDIEALQKKKIDKSNVLLDKVHNADVFDFESEASPVVSKVTKTGKTRQTKGVQRGKKASGLSRKPTNENNEKEGDNNKENDSTVKGQKTTRRSRAKRETNTVERVRKNSNELDECELEISLVELSLDNGSFSDGSLLHHTNEANDLDEIELEDVQDDVVKRKLNNIEVQIDFDLEPIEIMRGETVKKGSKGGKKTGRRVKAAPKPDEAAEARSMEDVECNEEEDVIEDDGNDRRRSVEKMRSGRLCSMNELTHADLMDMPPCIEDTEPECNEESGSDIISTMESLYERLCKFPPNPQHSDVCHILALHHLNTDPLRAAFLLNDAMAVTFRHQIILNLDKKARREAKGSVASASKRVTTPEESLLFSGKDLQLRDMVKSIPEGWCVAQLSVISVGLPCKQMILTRFVKDEDPIILKLPGFSSPQGRHVLKDFSMILENNAESAKIESTTEWWNMRRKLDTDMENVVDRMEKHLLGHWRCAVTAGEFQDKILYVVCKEISNITGKDVRKAHTELLLMAHKIVTEKEMGQCVSELLGVNVPSVIENIVSVLKKYSKLNVGNGDKHSHTILILDKTIQHLPWESIPVLCDKSVSRMPCLSHLVTQLNNHYKGKNSVFVKGVNSRNTFYILNPDSNLPRTQDFFKEWFESEKGWSGVIGCRPSSEQFIDALTNKDFLIFCGHGSGGRIFSSDEIEKLTARAVTMLMGCSSGRLHVKGQLEPTGMMISYFLAGCPSMVANLWDVTDKDIDKFTEDLIKTWMSSSHGTYLTTLVQKSRAVCKLKYLNGLAPVVYGLPVFINKGKK